MEDQRILKKNRIPIKAVKKSKVLEFATRLRSSSRENTDQLKDSLDQLSPDFQTENGLLKRPIHHITGKENVNLKSKEPGNRVESLTPLASVKENQKTGQKTGLGGFLKTKLFKRNFQQVVDSKLTEEKPSKCFQEDPPESPRSRKDLYVRSLETKVVTSPKTIKKPEATITTQPLSNQLGAQHNDSSCQNPNQSTATIDEGPIIRKAIPVAKQAELEPSPVIQKKVSITKPGISKIPAKPTSGTITPQGSFRQSGKQQLEATPSSPKRPSSKATVNNKLTINKFGFANNLKTHKTPETVSSDSAPDRHSNGSEKSTKTVQRSFGYNAHHQNGKSKANNKPGDSGKTHINNVPTVTLNSKRIETTCSEISVNDKTPPQSADKIILSELSNLENCEGGSTRCQVQTSVIKLAKSNSFNIGYISTTCNNSDFIPTLNSSQNQQNSQKQSNLKKCVSFSNIEIGSYYSNPHLDSDAGQVKGILKKSLDSVCSISEPPVRTILKKSSSFTHGQKPYVTKDSGLPKTVSFNLGKNIHHIFTKDGDIERSEDKTAITSQLKPDRSESQDIRESPEIDELLSETNVPQPRHDISMAGHSQYGKTNITPASALKINYVGFVDNHMYEYSSSSDQDSLEEVDYLPLKQDGVRYAGASSHSVNVSSQSEKTGTGENSGNSINTVNNERPIFSKKSYVEAGEGLQGFLKKRSKKCATASSSSCAVRGGATHKGNCVSEQICLPKDIPGPKIIYYPKMESTENTQGKDSKPPRRVSPTKRNGSPCKDASGNTTKIPANGKTPAQSRLACKEKAKSFNGTTKGVQTSSRDVQSKADPSSEMKQTTAKCGIPKSTKSSSPTPKMSSSKAKSSNRCLIPKINQQDPLMDYGSKTPEGQNDKTLSDSESKHHKSHSSLNTDTSPCKIGKQGLGLITTSLSKSHGNNDTGQVTSFQAPTLLVNNKPIKTDDRKRTQNGGDIDDLTTSSPDCQRFTTSSIPDLKEVAHVVNIQDRNDTQKSKINPSRRRIPTGIPSRVTPQKPLVADDKIIQTNYNTCVGGTRGISDNKNIRDNQLREHFGGDEKCVSEQSSVIVFNNGGNFVKGVHRDKNVNFGEQLSPLCNVVRDNNDLERERNVVVKNVPEQTNLDFSDDSIEFDITRENREGFVADEHSVIDKYSNSRESEIKTGHRVKIVKENESNISSSGLIISNQAASSRASDIHVPNQEFSHSKTSASSDPRSKSKSKIAKPINKASLKSLLKNTNTVSKVPTKSNSSVQGHDIRAQINGGNKIDGTCVTQIPGMERKCKEKQATKERMPSRESKNDKCEATNTPANQLQTINFSKTTNQHGASSKNLLMTSKIPRNGGIKTGEGIGDDKLNGNQLSGESLETKTKPATSKITVYKQTAITSSGTKSESTDIGNMTLIARASQNDDVTTLPGAFSNEQEDYHLKVEAKQPKIFSRQTKDREKAERRNEKVDQTKKEKKGEIKDEVSTECYNKSTLRKAESVETENVKDRLQKKVKASSKKCSESNKTLRVNNKAKGTKLPKRQIAKSDSKPGEKNGLLENCDVIKHLNISLNENNISIESSSSLKLHVEGEKNVISVKSDKNKHLVEKEVVFSQACESIGDVVTFKVNQTNYSSASKTSSEIDVLKVDHVIVSPSRIPIKKGSRSRDNSESPNRTIHGHLSKSHVSENIHSKLTSPRKIQSKRNSDYFEDKEKQCSFGQKIKSKPSKSDLCDNKDLNKDKIFSVQSNIQKGFTESLSMSSNNKHEVFNNKFMNNEENTEIVSNDLHVNKSVTGSIPKKNIEKKRLRNKEGFINETEGKTVGLYNNKDWSETEEYKTETSPVETEKEELTKSQLGLLTFPTELSQTDSESKIEQFLSTKHNSLEDNMSVLNRSSRVLCSDENNRSDKSQYYDKKNANTSERVNLNSENKRIKNSEACVEDYERIDKTRNQDNSKNVNTVKRKSKTKHEIGDIKYSDNLKTKFEKILSDIDSNLDDDSLLVCENGVMKLVDKSQGILKSGQDGLHSDNRVAEHHMGVNNVSNSKGNKHGLVDQLTGNSDQRKMANDNRNQALNSGGLQSTQGISGDHSTNKITSLKGQNSNSETNRQMIDRTREATLQEQAAGVELKKADDGFNGFQGNDDLIEGLSPRGHQGEIQSSDIRAESFNNKLADNDEGITIAEKKKKKSTQKSIDSSPKSTKRWDSSPTHIRRNITSPRHARRSETSPKHARKEQQILKKSVSVDERGHEELTLMTKLERLSRGLPIYDKKSPEIQRRAKSASPDMADKRRKLTSPSRQPSSPKQHRQPKRPSDVQILPECPKDSKTSPTKTSHPESPTPRTNSNPSSPKGNKKAPMEQSKTKKNLKLSANADGNSSGSRIPMTKTAKNPEKIKSVTICDSRSSSQCSTRENSVEDDRISRNSEASLRSEISSKLSSWTTSAKMDGTRPKSSLSRTSRENSIEDDRMSTNSDTSFPSFSSTSKSSRTESKSSRQIPISKSKGAKIVKTSEDSYTPSSTRESSVESQLSFASDISSISSVSTSGKSSKSIPRLGKSVPTTSTPNKKTTENKVASKTSVKQNGAKKPKSARMPTYSER
ncbi:hypothetical protein LOTGIDRAFT_174149 [Lottia gigantea]|uniref:Uncharacterized protein n=1 Tax=Lottia gigantea TaxID=225164 RepID=V4AN79_LOTGI|nr:hypothetical protein LOTGIDRAFT_174149 [Lottia gigantea]ESO98612.1 hypothetical protein LOTGIDRAFT_174149 [Lottia gigantea]